MKIFYEYEYFGLTNSSSCRDGNQFNAMKLVDRYFSNINEHDDFSSIHHLTYMLNQSLTIYDILIRDHYNGKYLFKYIHNKSNKSLIVLFESLKYKIQSMHSIRDINECVSMIIYVFNKGVKDEEKTRVC